MNEVYCPSCRGLIPSDASICPLCGKPATARLRMETETLEQEAARRAVEEAKVQAEKDRVARIAAEVAAVRPDVNLSHLTDSQREKFLKNSNKGICSGCRSQNISDVSYRTGGNPFWFNLNVIAALFWFFVSGPTSCFWAGPVAGAFFGLFPAIIHGIFAMASKPHHSNGRKCNYCGNRWQV
jgi:hypothetical protein